MIEFILGIYFSWWFLLALTLAIPYSLYNEYDEFGIFLLLLLFVALLLISNISWITAAIIILTYIPAGIAWSFWRWKRRGDDIVEKFESLNNDWERKRLKRKLDPKENISYIAATILGWPFSMLENVTSDAFIFIKNLVGDRLINMYSKISAKHLSKINTTYT